MRTSQEKKNIQKFSQTSLIVHLKESVQRLGTSRAGSDFQFRCRRFRKSSKAVCLCCQIYAEMSEVKKDVITLESGQLSVEKWTLRSESVSVEIMSLGCVITAIKTPDRNGHSADIVLGFDELGSKFNKGCF